MIVAFALPKVIPTMIALPVVVAEGKRAVNDVYVLLEISLLEAC